MTAADGARRDHRAIGRRLDIYAIEPEVGRGLVLWPPNGEALRATIGRVWRRFHSAAGYRFVDTPRVAKAQLWDTSGHLASHGDELFPQLELHGERHIVTPANCPLHMVLYRRMRPSWRDLPVRFAELSTIHREEPSGSLRGLFRVRSVTQDDGHIFCRVEEAEDEIVRLLALSRELLAAFGFTNIELYLGTGGEKAIGDTRLWDRATSILRLALDRLDVPFEERPGDATFYAPRIGGDVVDARGTRWPLPDLQLDLQLPERCGLTFVATSGDPERPAVLHRTVIGSLERFIAALLEHYDGRLPGWLAPVQVVALPIRPEHRPFAERVVEYLAAHGSRAIARPADHSLAARVRAATDEGVPCLAIIGDAELARSHVRVRWSARDQETMPPERLAQALQLRFAEPAPRAFSPQWEETGRCSH